MTCYIPYERSIFFLFNYTKQEDNNWFLAKIWIKIDFFNFYFLNKDYSFAIEGIDMKC